MDGGRLRRRLSWPSLSRCRQLQKFLVIRPMGGAVHAMGHPGLVLALRSGWANDRGGLLRTRRATHMRLWAGAGRARAGRGHLRMSITS